MNKHPEANLRSVAVLGIGAITPVGRDLADIAKRLSQEPATGSGPLRVSDELLADAAQSRNLRRADRFTRMAVMAATDAWKAAQKECEGIAPERVGIIVSSGLGPHCRGFRFLDGMIDEGDSAASPTDFSHSVHGAACGYITALLDIRGPSLTMTDFESGFDEAVRLARMWLDQGACDRVLMGAVEELGDVLMHCADRIAGNNPELRAGEGAVFFVLGPGDTLGGRELNAESTTAINDAAKWFGFSASVAAFGRLGEMLTTRSVQRSS